MQLLVLYSMLPLSHSASLAVRFPFHSQTEIHLLKRALGVDFYARDILHYKEDKKISVVLLLASSVTFV